MGASILDRLNKRNGTTDHTIAGALKSYIIRNGGDPTGLQSISDLVEALPEGTGGSGSANVGQHIYGVKWTYAYTEDDEPVKYLPSAGVRTDEAADFSDPVPFVMGSSQNAMILSALSCGSPFDSLYPWNGMERYRDRLAGEFVSIPKFWYKWTKTDDYLQLQVATYAAEGFHVSPAHQPRGEETADRDVVYIGRYKCTKTQGISNTNEEPAINMTREYVRSLLSEKSENLNISGYSMQDYAMFWTWRMLYLVEFANWDGQAVIGDGTGSVNIDDSDDSRLISVTGLTDNMPYHTGTMRTDKDTEGQGVQYRWIEDPWGNVMEFIDGWRMDTSDKTIYVTTNLADFSDSEGGTAVGDGENVSGWIVDWTVPETDGYDWALIPITTATHINSVADCSEFSGPVLFCGGVFDGSNSRCGPFCLYSYGVSSADGSLGARLQKIP